MDGITIAIVLVTGIGLICAVILSVASKIMAVEEDERFPAVREALPGANCGACGYAGCDGYAHALIDDEGVKTNLCIPGGDGVSQALSALLGRAYEDVARQVALISCRGDCSVTSPKMDYQGINTCRAAKLLFGGTGKCAFGCMGFGDCAAVCPADAICIEAGIARIDPRKCIGCSLCVAACPSGLIAMMPAKKQTLVTCSNTEKGAVTRSVCSRGCIACKKCEKECPVAAIHVLDNLARIDYTLCINCGRCIEVCPVGCILEAPLSAVQQA